MSKHLSLRQLEEIRAYQRRHQAEKQQVPQGDDVDYDAELEKLERVAQYQKARQTTPEYSAFLDEKGTPLVGTKSNKEREKSEPYNPQSAFREREGINWKATPTRIGKLARSAALGAAGIGDTLSLPYNLPAAAVGLPTGYPSQGLKHLIDTATDNKFAPKTERGKLIGAAVEGASSLPVGSKLAKTAAAYLPGKAGKAASVVERMYEPTVPNLVSNAAAMAAAEHDMGPHSGFIEQVAMPLTAGVAAHKLARSGQKFAKNRIEGAPIRGPITRTKEALERNKNALAESHIRKSGEASEYLVEAPHRHKTHELLERKIPGKRELGIFEEVPAGERLLKDISSYTKKKSKNFGNRKEEINKKIKDIDVDASSPIEFGVDVLRNTKDPNLQQMWLKSPLGKQTLNILGLPSDIKRGQLLKYLEENPGALKRKIKHSDFDRLRMNIDNSLSQKEWNAIGSVDEGQLKKLRKNMREAEMKAVRSYDKNTQKALKDYNKTYSRYAEQEIPFHNEINKHKGFPGSAYETVRGKLKGNQKGTEIVDWALKASPKKNRSNLATSFVRSLGMKEGIYDIPTFYNNFHNMSAHQQRSLMKSLPSEVSSNLKKQMNMHKNIERINSRTSPTDLFYNSNGIGWVSRSKKALTRAGMGAYYSKPKKKEHLLSLLEKEALPTNVKREELLNPAQYKKNLRPATASRLTPSLLSRFMSNESAASEEE